MKLLLLATSTLLLAASLLPAERPNILLIMVDDLGFSDLGYMGGEIETPNLDKLAHGGVRFSHFYNGGRCCPTRATLLTGLHPHQTGIGHMTSSPTHINEPEPPAYQGYLNRHCATLAELLKPAGYSTLMTGKWHLGFHDKDRWPLQRGFDRFYGCIPGATRFFYPEHPRGMTRDNTPLEKPLSTTDEPFYTTDAFTDYAIDFIAENEAKTDDPFFLYLAYTAPHWPLQAFEDDIAKYRGKYKLGWDQLRKKRYQRQLELGLIDPRWKLSPRPASVPAWDSLSKEKQDEMDLKMAIYAAMVDRVDQNIGKLTAFLNEQKLLDNTLILFLSDNGACQEGGPLGRGEYYDIARRNQQPANSYGEAWANLGSTPFRLYKHHAHEGGTATPFFLHWPAQIEAQSEWYRSPGHILDVVPTLLNVTGADYPGQMHGNPLPPLSGISLRPSFGQEPLAREGFLAMEHESNAFLLEGEYKLVGNHLVGTTQPDFSKWELYNLAEDRTELQNLAPTQPEKLKELADKWVRWAHEAKVYPRPRS
ncbi:arylsulfatase [Roseibacillus ishigakijimensis]|uniref:Arylsulfatase n=1 Tax=Roseibacillus ishigakijimensis TaxID=454146 RepID=A0A934RUJ6_9BACT|nr:arylsulfatase [Roseibacillus ishigakijimensis]MBK1835269.1 arylsulfatase [Roseibacillus ishigakijimensis]